MGGVLLKLKMASTITHTGDYAFTFTAGQAYTLTTIKLFEYSVGGYWNLIDDNDLATVADGGEVDFTVSSDNLYKIEITYTDGISNIKLDFEYLVTDGIQAKVLALLQKVFCKCNPNSICKQKDYYNFNKFLMTIASGITYAWRNKDASSSELLGTQRVTIEQINARLDAFYTNCTIDSCSSNTCNCY